MILHIITVIFNLKKKNWLNSWEPILQQATSSFPIVQPRFIKSTQDNISHAQLIKHPSFDNMRPRSLSNDSRRGEKLTGLKHHQRRRSAHPSEADNSQQPEMENLPSPMALSPKVIQRESAPTTPSIKQLEDIFERGSENRTITNQETTLNDIYDLLRKIYKETLQLKKEVRIIKADLAELKDQYN